MNHNKAGSFKQGDLVCIDWELSVNAHEESFKKCYADQPAIFIEYCDGENFRDPMSKVYWPHLMQYTNIFAGRFKLYE